MADGPTTLNGPLHTDEASLPAREITAYFRTIEQAHAIRDRLVADRIGLDRITVRPAAEIGTPKPVDRSVIGAIREAILPEDSQAATRDAVSHGDAILTVVPQDGEVDRIIHIIQAGDPHHFDAALERWRNSPPN